jgi:hypothetical protein
LSPVVRTFWPGDIRLSALDDRGCADRLVTLLALMLFGCARPPRSIGIRNTSVPVASLPGLSRHRIFIISTVGPLQIAGALFSASRASNLNSPP